MNEEELIKAILAGNTQLYAQIVKQYQDIVANLTYKLCGNKLEVEEVTQQVFVELYSALPRFKFNAKLSTFIYRITVNVVSKMLDKNKRYVTPDPDERPKETPSDTLNVEQQIIYNERIAQLRTAIGRLKYEQRTALVLYTYDDFSYQQIADVMQCTTAKVESLIFRAKKNLAKMLESK